MDIVNLEFECGEDGNEGEEKGRERNKERERTGILFEDGQQQVHADLGRLLTHQVEARLHELLSHIVAGVK
jgi:hypothetical protein